MIREEERWKLVEKINEESVESWKSCIKIVSSRKNNCSREIHILQCQASESPDEHEQRNPQETKPNIFFIFFASWFLRLKKHERKLRAKTSFRFKNQRTLDAIYRRSK